ncbi:hypothetical protein HDU67_003564 [Dinochytrium kinnereticum]|nr:hypothetical protein HDU67_003564 [Dinochytrium kinnereticum]
MYGAKPLRDLFYNEDVSTREGAGFPPISDMIFAHHKPVPTLDGEKFRERKAHLVQSNTPATIDGVLKDRVVPVVGNWLDEMAGRVENGEGRVLVGEEFRRGFFRVILAVVFGVMEPSEGVLKDMRSFIAALDAVPINIPFTPYGNGMAARDRLFILWKKQVGAHRAHPDEYKNTLLMALMLHGKDHLSDEDLALEAHHFLFGACGIVFAAMSALMGLHKHPYHKYNLLEELDANASILKNPTLKGLTKLPILQATIKESLRVFPVVPIQFAKCKQDTVYDGYDIPKGSILVAGLYATNKDAEMYEDPDNFNPTRFLPSSPPVTADASLEPFTWVPFGGGDRSITHRCPGYPTAMAIAEIGIGAFLSRFSVEIGDRVHFNWGKMLVEPAEGFPAVLRLRK